MQLWAASLLLLLTPALARVHPTLVVPTDWVTDRHGHFMFLPLSVPDGINLDVCKVLTNGDSILVVVTEQPQNEPETDALRKYKLIVDALKVEAGHDEHLLQEKLGTWLATEEDDEVRAHVQAAMDSLSQVHAAKHSGVPRTISVNLGFLQRPVGADGPHGVKPGLLPAPVSHHALVHQHGSASTVTSGQTQTHASHRASAGIIKESFSVEIPYPVPAEDIFVLKRSPTQLLVGMPLVRTSLGAQGVSTGGVPFSRVPVFNLKNQHLAGPMERPLASLSRGLDLHDLEAPGGLPVLTE